MLPRLLLRRLGGRLGGPRRLQEALQHRDLAADLVQLGGCTHSGTGSEDETDGTLYAGQWWVAQAAGGALDSLHRDAHCFSGTIAAQQAALPAIALNPSSPTSSLQHPPDMGLAAIFSSRASSLAMYSSPCKRGDKRTFETRAVRLIGEDQDERTNRATTVAAAATLGEPAMSTSDSKQLAFSMAFFMKRTYRAAFSLSSSASTEHAAQSAGPDWQDSTAANGSRTPAAAQAVAGWGCF